MKLRKILNLLRNSKQMFKNMWNQGPVRHIELVNVPWEVEGSNVPKAKDKRITKKPVEIFEEIIGKKPKINLNNLDGQIAIVKERKKVLSQHLKLNNLDHEEMAIRFLESRKNYEKHKDKFKWAITNDDLIDKLCMKYKVKRVDISSYYRNIPKEGVDEIKKFGEALACVTNCDPYFKLIIDEGKEKKKDPILLAQSPFGNWWYILGAWDKEVEIVDKLIYKRG